MRVYTNQCITDLEAIPETKHARELYLNSIIPSRNDAGKEDEFDYNFDSIRFFRDSFKHSVVIFIMSDSLIRMHLSKADSAFQLLQASLAFHDRSSKGCSKVCICSDHSSAIESIHNMVDALSTTKVEKKLQYFQTESRKQLFVSIENETKIEDMLNEVLSPKLIKDRVTATLQEWGDTCNISEDLSVVINYLRSLENIMNADEDVLMSLPIQGNTKSAVMQFFRGVASAGIQPDHRIADENHDFVNKQHRMSNPFQSDHTLNRDGRVYDESNHNMLMNKSGKEYSNPRMYFDHGFSDKQLISHIYSRDRFPNYTMPDQRLSKRPMVVHDHKYRIVPPAPDLRNGLQNRGLATSVRYSPPNYQNNLQLYAPRQMESDYFDAVQMNSHAVQLDDSLRGFETNPFRGYSFE